MTQPGYPKIGRKDFFAKITPLLSPKGLSRVEEAYRIAKGAHKGQSRDGGAVRYFEHPKAVAWICITELKIADWIVIVLCLLHDVMEDSFLFIWQTIERLFGAYIAMALKLLTKEPKDGYIERLREYGDWRVLLVKLCDRLHNLRTLSSCDLAKQKKQIAETKEKYVPLAELLIARLPAKNRWWGQYLKAQIEAIIRHYEEDVFPTADRA